MKKTIASVAVQTWQEFEYIVIDGGSSDGSEAYIESQNSKIDFWISEPDTGIYNAMNKGVKKASGEYVLFLNSGDHFFDDKVLEKNHTAIKSKDFIYFNLNLIDGKETVVRKYPEKLPFSYLSRDTLPHPATFIKKNLFDRIGLYDENLKIVSDWKFFLEGICKHNCSYLRIDDTLSSFYLDGFSSKLENKELIRLEKQLVLESGFSSYLEDVKELSQLKIAISNLRKSKKIQLLIKLGLLNKF